MKRSCALLFLLLVIISAHAQSGRGFKDEFNSAVMSMPNSNAVPNVALRIRLNSDFNETYRVDYVRWADLPPAINANEFVKRAGSKLMLGTREFRLAGTNAYYLQPEIVSNNAVGVRESLDKMLLHIR